MFEVAAEQGLLLEVTDDEGTDEFLGLGVVVQVVVAETADRVVL